MPSNFVFVMLFSTFHTRALRVKRNVWVSKRMRQTDRQMERTKCTFFQLFILNWAIYWVFSITLTLKLRLWIALVAIGTFAFCVRIQYVSVSSQCRSYLSFEILFLLLWTTSEHMNDRKNHVSQIILTTSEKVKTDFNRLQPISTDSGKQFSFSLSRFL